MAVFHKLRASFGRQKTAEDADTPIAVSTLNDKDPASGSQDDATARNGHDDVEAAPSEDVQHGVQDIQAVTLTWTKKSLITVFILSVLVHSAYRPVLVRG